jgi:hypothetical protein
MESGALETDELRSKAHFEEARWSDLVVVGEAIRYTRIG